jgi:hypothetical protein
MNPYNPYPEGYFPRDDDADSEGSVPPEVRNLFRLFYFSRPEGENPNVRKRIGKGIPDLSNRSDELEWGREENERTYLRVVDTFILIQFIGQEIQRELEGRGLSVGLFVLPNWRDESGNAGRVTVKLLRPDKEQSERLIEDRQYITDAIRMRLGCTDVVGEDCFGNKLFHLGLKDSSHSSPSSGTKETTTGKEMTATLVSQENNRTEYDVVPEQIDISGIARESVSTPAPPLTFGQFISNCERAGISRDFIESLPLPDSVARQMRDSLYSGLDGMIFNPVAPSPSPTRNRQTSVAAPVAAPETPRKKPGRKPGGATKAKGTRGKAKAKISTPAPESSVSNDGIKERMMMFPKDFKPAKSIGKALSDKGETVYSENLRRALTVNGKPRNMYANLQRIADETEYTPWWEKLMSLTPGDREVNEPFYREAARWLLAQQSEAAA